MTDYTYSRVAALNFITVPTTVARSATGSVYAIGDTTYTTPLNVTMVIGGIVTTTISSDANGFFPDFTVANRTSVVFKQAGTSFTSVLTTTDPVPGPQGTPGNTGAAGAKGDRGDLATWQTATWYPLNQVIANPVGDLVKVTTAHTSGVSYDATKFDYVVPPTLTPAALNATILTEVAAPISAAVAPVAAAKMDKHQVKLRRWYARLGWRESAPARILACGDSITEGNGAGTITRRWQTLLQTRLRAATYQNFGAIFPFIPANPATPTTGYPVVRTGTYSAISKGLAYRGISIGTDGKVTFTFTGTRAKVQFVSLVDAASVGGVKVDAGSIVPVTIAMTASSETAVMYDTGNLTAGVHTIEVTRDATSTTNPVLSGLATWDGDEGKGIDVIDSAKAGTTASVFANPGLARLQARCAMAIGSYGLAILGYGTNDFSAGQTPTQFKANTNILIGELRSNGFTGSIILMLPYLGQGRDATAWDAYGAALKEIADGDPDILFFDLTEKMPDVPTPYNSTDAMSLYADTLHPADAGHGYIADMLLSLIMPR